MSNVKWGFEHEYGHKVLPTKWHQSSGFSVYDPEPLRKKNSFREADLPIYREGFISHTTSYEDRAQDPKNSMSAYGCHREMPWGNTLRSPRNPFPGSPSRETRYLQEPSPSGKWRTSEALSLTARSITAVNSPRGSRLATPAMMEHSKRLKGWLHEWQQTSALCRQEHARATAGLVDDDI